MNDWLDSPAAFEVLQLMPWTTAPIANGLRADGHHIREKCEDEQAYVMRWLLKFVIAHGAEWKTAATAELVRMRDAKRLCREPGVNP